LAKIIGTFLIFARRPPASATPVLRAGDLVYLTTPGGGRHVFEFDPVPAEQQAAYAGTPGSISYLANFIALDGSGATGQSRVSHGVCDGDRDATGPVKSCTALHFKRMPAHCLVQDRGGLAAGAKDPAWLSGCEAPLRRRWPRG
jgi:hypothetical protein